ncbi:MAG: hypothetical protein ABII22_04640 [Candidatus Micrarchaeota archaeon]
MDLEQLLTNSQKELAVFYNLLYEDTVNSSINSNYNNREQKCNLAEAVICLRDNTGHMIVVMRLYDFLVKANKRIEH